MNKPATETYIAVMTIVILIYLAICTIITNVNVERIIEQKQYELSWKDNIHNPDNSEYLEEVKFNNTAKDLQIEFCYRYWNTLDDNSKEWFKQQMQ